MTNKEYIVKLLSDEDAIDDGCASYEALVYHNIKCPYRCGDSRAHCHNKPLDYTNIKRCTACKMEWLESEVDE